MNTQEQLAARATFTALVARYRLRVTTDAEGWPEVLGRGTSGARLEWHDAETVAVFGHAPQLRDALLAIPGVRRHQIGDREFRLLVPVESDRFPGALGGVIRRCRLRTQWQASERQREALDRGRHHFPPRRLLCTRYVAGEGRHPVGPVCPLAPGTACSREAEA